MKRFIVDGIILTQDNDGNLKIEFKVGGMVHTFKINSQNAQKMAEVMSALYLEKN